MNRRLKTEPIIYHGYTLTTKLSFHKVIQTIKVQKYYGITNVATLKFNLAYLGI